MKSEDNLVRMYENVKYLGHTLKQWRDEVFNGTYSLGELYQMVNFRIVKKPVPTCMHVTVKQSAPINASGIAPQVMFTVTTVKSTG